MTELLGVPPRSGHNRLLVDDQSPLDSGDLRKIDECLNLGNLDEAQRLLARVGDRDLSASSYLAVRLLYLRERLTPPAVAERLRELLAVEPKFPEAQALLELAAAGFPGRSTLKLSTKPDRDSNPFSLSNPPVSVTEPAPGHRAESPPPDSDRPTWVPDYSLPTAATQYPPPRADGSLPPSRRIQVDTRDEPPRALDGLSPPPRYSNPPPARPPGRYAMTSEPPEPSADPTSRTSRAPAMSSAIGADPTFPQVPAVSIGPVVTPRPAREGRYSITNAGTESFAPPRSIRKPERSGPPKAQVAGIASRTNSDAASPVLEAKAKVPFRVPHPNHITGRENQEPAVERLLLQGDPIPAQREFESSAETALARVDTLGDAFAGWAVEGAELLMTAPATHSFGPFDRSLHSLARLDLALDALYFHPYSNAPLPLISVLGAYVGEALRCAHRGTWRVPTDSLLQARVLAGGYVWEPFRLVHERIQAGASVSLYRTLAPALAREGTLAWLASAKEQVPPPRLWHGPLNAAVLTQLGTDLLDSMWSLSCAQHYGGPLDGSVESLHALDQLMDVLARAGGPLSLEQPWTMRLTALATSYVGEVLRRQTGGYWTPSAGRPGEDSVVFRLGGGHEATPMANVLGRITSQKRFQLESYVRVLLRRLE